MCLHAVNCQVYYPIFSYVVLRLYIRGSRGGIFRNTFFVCIYTVLLCSLLGVSSGGQSFRLSSLVGEVWVVCYYLFLCRLLSLSLSVLGEWFALVFAYY
jgi:hypothetical protein